MSKAVPLLEILWGSRGITFLHPVSPSRQHIRHVASFAWEHLHRESSAGKLRGENLGVDGGLEFCFESPQNLAFVTTPLFDYTQHTSVLGGATLLPFHIRAQVLLQRHIEV